jgi:hypothetical protein
MRIRNLTGGQIQQQQKEGQGIGTHGTLVVPVPSIRHTTIIIVIVIGSGDVCRKGGRMAASSIRRRQDIPTPNETRDRVIVVAKNAAEAARKGDAKRARGSEVVRPNAKT